jgi:hypothetical protein
MRAQSSLAADQTAGSARTDELLRQLMDKLDDVDRRLNEVSEAVNDIREMMDGSKFTATGSSPTA